MAVILGMPAKVAAHDLGAGLLEIREGADRELQIALKVSAAPEAMRPAVDVALPSHCTAISPRQRVRVVGGILSTWRVSCDGPLMGSQLRGIWHEGQASVLVRIQLASGELVSDVLRPDAPAIYLKGRKSGWVIAQQHVVLGIAHIGFGFDHLLFLLGLVALARSRRQLLWTVTAFTAGHTMTLSLAALGHLRLASSPVEILIAASIVVLAIELTRTATQVGGNRAARARAGTYAALFGLLHGLGFAGALTELGLPSSEVPTALLGFNVGVELGQLAFVALALLLARAIKRAYGRANLLIPIVTPYVLGGAGSFLCLQRLASW